MRWNGKLVENECVEDAPSLLNSCSMLAKLLDYLDQMEAVEVTNDGKLKEIIDNMDNIGHPNKKKLSFFSEQLSLLSMSLFE